MEEQREAKYVEVGGERQNMGRSIVVERIREERQRQGYILYIRVCKGGGAGKPWMGVRGTNNHE